MRVIGVPRLADGPDLAALEAILATERPRLFFTQSEAHNPTGSDLSLPKAYRLLQLAEKHNLLLVEDDPFADFKPTSAVRLSMLDQLERTIYIGSFSKSFSAALRVGYIACSPELASVFAPRLADVSAVRTPDANTVVIELARPDVTLPDAFTSIMIVPRHLLMSVPITELRNAAWWKTPVGTGPFKWSKYLPDQYVELTANADYYRGKPKLDKLINRYFKDASAAALACSTVL